jgi:hypothetical protein
LIWWSKAGYLRAADRHSAGSGPSFFTRKKIEMARARIPTLAVIDIDPFRSVSSCAWLEADAKPGCLIVNVGKSNAQPGYPDCDP